jgi:hypothetical protein
MLSQTSSFTVHTRGKGTCEITAQVEAAVPPGEKGLRAGFMTGCGAANRANALKISTEQRRGRGKSCY